MKFFLSTNSNYDIRSLQDLGLLGGIFLNSDLPENYATSDRDKSEFEEIEEVSKIAKVPILISPDLTDEKLFLSAVREYLVIGPNIILNIPFSIEGIRISKSMLAGEVDVCISSVKDSAQFLVAAMIGSKYIIFDKNVDRKIIEESVYIKGVHSFDVKIGVSNLVGNKHISTVAALGVDFGILSLNQIHDIFAE